MVKKNIPNNVTTCKVFANPPPSAEIKSTRYSHKIKSIKSHLYLLFRAIKDAFQ